ncbi:MAG TPA: MFS transporter, partial [Candidatus Dormibacteraeota bacterium]|nr:MFS transporter [Candidatus Dormibacteraeota bacterium]
MRLAYKWQAAIVVVLGMFMAVLDNTIVNVALPRMQNAFHTDWQSVVWVASAYFLSSAAVIPV